MESKIVELAGMFSRDLKIEKNKYLSGEEVSENKNQSYLSRLEKIDLSELSTDEERKAFWINLYNGFTNYLIIKKKVKKSLLRRPLIFRAPKIRLGIFCFSLNDIEHGILRKNKKSILSIRRQFGAEDERKKFMVTKTDYRIHFALNCGAKSCPAIRYYTASEIDNQLNMAEEVFVKEDFIVDSNKKNLRCSRIFKIYRDDFEMKYLNDPEFSKYRVKIMRYDWSVEV